MTRLLSGLITAYFAFNIWKGLAWTVRTGRVEAIESLNVVVVIMIAVVIYLAPHASMIVGRRWPRARLVTVIALAILAGWSFATTGSVLGVALILPTFLIAFVLMALLSVSYFLAAVLAVPG